jgi:hypothetical protein
MFQEWFIVVVLFNEKLRKAGYREQLPLLS